MDSSLFLIMSAYSVYIVFLNQGNKGLWGARDGLGGAGRAWGLFAPPLLSPSSSGFCGGGPLLFPQWRGKCLPDLCGPGPELPGSARTAGIIESKGNLKLASLGSGSLEPLAP